MESELSKLTTSQSQMDKLRQDEKEAYSASKADQTKRLGSVKLAIKLLRDYYASAACHDAASGAAGGVIGLLETIESDITKTMASLESSEECRPSFPPQSLSARPPPLTGGRL